MSVRFLYECSCVNIHMWVGWQSVTLSSSVIVHHSFYDRVCYSLGVWSFQKNGWPVHPSDSSVSFSQHWDFKYITYAQFYLGEELRTQVLMLTHPVPYWLPSYIDPKLSKKYAHMAFLDGSYCSLKQSCYSLRVYRPQYDSPIKCEKTQMDNDNSFFQSEKNVQ